MGLWTSARRLVVGTRLGAWLVIAFVLAFVPAIAVTVVQITQPPPTTVPPEIRPVSISRATSPGALAFRPGVTYAAAARDIYVAQVTRAAVPGARRAPPLPRGKVLLRNPDGGIAVDLAAPYGWHPETGRVNAPRGAYFNVPILPACQVITSRSDPGTDCTAEDRLAADPGRVRDVPLP